MPPRSCMFIQVQGLALLLLSWHWVWTQTSPIKAAGFLPPWLPEAVCFRTGFHATFTATEVGKVFDPLIAPVAIAVLDCALSLVMTELMGLGQNTPTHITSLAPYWGPTWATTEQRCSSKNWSGIQILELFRNINFSSGHQKSWSVIGCWVCHRTDPTLFLSDYLAWGKHLFLLS